MKWENLNFHTETLLPGIVTLFLLVDLLPETFVVQFKANYAAKLLAKEVFAVGIFFATAYIVGAISIVVSRLFVDRPSEYLLRPLLLRIFARGELKRTSRKGINDEYRKEIGAAFTRDGRQELINEIVTRRERGRMVRTALIPSILVVVIATRHWVWCEQIAAALGAFFFVLFLYAYVEVTIYEECLLSRRDNGNVVL